MTVNVNGPAAVGVPVRVPSPFSVRPGGRVPAVTENENGPGESARPTCYFSDG